MIVLSDSTAKAIRQVLSERIAIIGMRDTTGKVEQIAEYVKALEPMDDPCSMCVHEDKAGYEKPCDTCVYGRGTTSGFEAKGQYSGADVIKDLSEVDVDRFNAEMYGTFAVNDKSDASRFGV